MTITTELVSFIIVVLGFVTTAWVRIEAIVNRSRAECLSAVSAAAAKADFALTALAEHRLHVAQTYVSNSGLREAIAPVMRALEGIDGQVSHLNERIDRVIEGQPQPARRAAKGASA